MISLFNEWKHNKYAKCTGQTRLETTTMQTERFLLNYP